MTRRSHGARAAERLAAAQRHADAIMARLIAEAPPLTDAQRARLGPLCDLSSVPGAYAEDRPPDTRSRRRRARPQ